MLVLGWVIYFSFGILWFCMSPMLTAIIDELKMSHTEAGLVLSSVNIMYVLTSIPMGLFVDRVNLRKSVATGMIIIGVFGLLRGVSISFITLFAFAFLFGIGCTIITPAIPKIAATWFPPENVGAATGTMLGGAWCGMAIMMALANSIIVPYCGGWRGALHFLGIYGLMIGFIWWILAGDRPAFHAGTPGSESSEKVSMNEAFFQVSKSKNVWLLMLAGVCFFGVVHGFQQWLPYVLETQGLSRVTSGYISSLFSWSGLAATIVIPVASDRIGLRKPFLIVSSLITAVAIYIVMSRVTDGPALWAGVATIGFFSAGIFPLIMTVPIELEEVGPRHTGGAAGMINSVGHLGGFLGPTLVGYLKDIMTSFLPGMIMISAMAGISIIMILPLKETGRTNEDKT